MFPDTHRYDRAAHGLRGRPRIAWSKLRSLLRPTGLPTLPAALLCSALVGIALWIGITIEHLLGIENLLLIFIPVVLFSAVRYGFLLAVWVSLLSVLGTSFLLAAPRFSLAVSDPENVLALTLFLITAAITSSLAARARQRAEAADYHSRAVERLYAVGARLMGISTIDGLAAEAVRQLESALKREVQLTVDAGSGPRVYGGHSTDRSASRLYFPLETARGNVGSIAVSGATVLSLEDRRLIQALGDQVAVNLERLKLAEDMRKAEVLAETEKLRTALLTSISHDLRTPLAAILGNVTSLSQFWRLYDDATREEMLTVAEDEARRLARFVDNLLHMTRIDAGALHPTLEMIDVSDVVGSAIERLSRVLSQHVVGIDIDDGAPMIAVDYMLMEHVLVNLLENAAKYSPPGTLIEVNARSDRNDVSITIRDEGSGIPPAEIGRVFERFFRASAADRRPAGTGLGLAICKGFVEAMGGEISASNRADRSGAVFTVRLPSRRSRKEIV